MEDRYPIEFMIMSFWHENYCTHVTTIKKTKSFAHQTVIRSKFDLLQKGRTNV